MKTKILALTLALVMVLSLAACGGDTPETDADTSGNTTTTTPATETPNISNDPDHTQNDNVNNSPLILQIIDSRNGIFRLYIEDLQETYTLGDSLDEIYQWSCMFFVDDIIYQMALGIRDINNESVTLSSANISYNFEDFSSVNGHAFVTANGGNDHKTDAFPLKIQVMGKNIYFTFSIPDTYNIDLYALEGFSYRIYNEPDGINESKGISAVNTVVDNIGDGITFEIPSTSDTTTTTDTSTPSTTPPPDVPIGDNTPSGGGFFPGIDDSQLPDDIVKKIVGTLDRSDFSNFSEYGGDTDKTLFFNFSNVTEAEFAELKAHYAASATRAEEGASYDGGSYYFAWGVVFVINNNQAYEQTAYGYETNGNILVRVYYK